jgi:phosphocarrier protein
MGLLLLAAARGTTIRISADGADERAALEALAALVESGFGEDLCSA